MSIESRQNKFTSLEIFLILFLYKIIIEFIYIFSISRTYSYSGLTLDYSFLAFWISILYLIVLALSSPKEKSRPSTYMFITIELFIVVPLLSYFWLNNQSKVYTTYIIISMIIISTILKIKPISLNLKEKTAQIWINFIFIFYVLITLYLIAKRGGIDPRALDFDSIYELRSENEIQGLLGYLMNWCTKAFFPFFFLYYYYKKKYFMLLPIIIFQLLMYLSFGNKAFLFSIGIVLISTYLMQKKNYLYGMVLYMSSLLIFAYLAKIYNISDALHRAIPYRMIYIPAQIQYQYYEFFSIREKVYFADGVIGKLFSIDNPYSAPIPLVISRFFLEVDAYSNTGIFSDAYANGGVLLLLVFVIVFALILYLIDSTTMKLPLYTIVGSFSYIMFVLNDTGLLTTLLTGGLGLMIFLFLLFNSSISDSSDLIENR